MLHQLIALFLELYYLPGETLLTISIEVAPSLVIGLIGEGYPVSRSILAAQVSAVSWLCIGLLSIAFYRYCRALFWALKVRIHNGLAPVRRLIRSCRIKLAEHRSPDQLNQPSPYDTISMEVVNIDDLSWRLLRVAYQCDGVSPCTREKLMESLQVSKSELRRLIKELNGLELIEATASAAKRGVEYRLTTNGKYYFHAANC